jgi:hypothetical protein
MCFIAGLVTALGHFFLIRPLYERLKQSTVHIASVDQSTIEPGSTFQG